MRDAAMLREAWEQLQHNLALKAPGVDPAGYLVEEMLPVHLEMIAGAKNDPVFGPLVLLGFGGIHVELFRDLAMRLAPLEPEQVQEMLGELKSAALLSGFRGCLLYTSLSLAFRIMFSAFFFVCSSLFLSSASIEPARFLAIDCLI